MIAQNKDQENTTTENDRFMTPLSVILERLRVRGIESEFKWSPEGFTTGTGKYYQPDEMAILKTYRFEGESDPADNAIIYLLEANDGLKGYSLDMYGMYSSHDREEGYDQFIRSIPIAGRDEQLFPENPETDNAIW